MASLTLCTNLRANYTYGLKKTSIVDMCLNSLTAIAVASLLKSTARDESCVCSAKVVELEKQQP
jgi:hypothetical protein